MECILTNSETGKPPNQVTVDTINLNYNFWSYERSDKNGKCIFKSVPGRHKIKLGSDGYAMFKKEFEVSAGDLKTLEIALTPIDNDLTGTITDTNGVCPALILLSLLLVILRMYLPHQDQTGSLCSSLIL